MTTTTYVNDITDVTRITSVTCCNCGLVFGMGVEFIARRREDHRSWYCPNGHSQYYGGDNEEERLRKALTRSESHATHLRDQLDSTERSRRAYKGKVTQIKRRVGNGVCPCCNRTFADLQRHMSGQHPDFVEVQS